MKKDMKRKIKGKMRRDEGYEEKEKKGKRDKEGHEEEEKKGKWDEEGYEEEDKSENEERMTNRNKLKDIKNFTSIFRLL